MSDIVYSLLYRPDGADSEEFDRFLGMARLWAAHLRGPGGHGGPVVLLSNLPDLEIEGVEILPVPERSREGRAVLPLKVLAAEASLTPSEGDRIMQLDVDSLARHPIEPLFQGIRPGEMRVAPSGLTLMHWQQLGHLLGRWERLWYGRIRGWKDRLGVSSSVSACAGSDWKRFVTAWADAIREHERRGVPRPLPGDQAYLNYLHAFGGIAMRPYGEHEVHHLRHDEPITDAVERAIVLHFPVPEKLERMREWSRTRT